MAQIVAFNGLRPRKELADKVAELPYDVVDSEEAKVIAGDNRYSFFHVSKPEIDLGSEIDPYSKEVYNRGRQNLEAFINESIMVKDDEPKLYLYTLEMDGRSQTGIVCCVSIDDYLNDIVKKHELTREDKEKDRMTHLDILNAQTGLVYLLYREDGSVRSIIQKAAAAEPEYDFTADDGIRHTIRVIDATAMQQKLIESMVSRDLYIADGHHRAASAVKVGQKRRNEGMKDGEHNHFLAVLFPHDELRILAYNRVVRDLNGMSVDAFIEKLGNEFDVEKSTVSVPEQKHQVCMFLDGSWYTLSYKGEVPADPVGSLDVKILQDRVLSALLGIENPRKDSRINFVGGIRGTSELEKLVNNGKYQAAFSMYPTSVEDLINVSDTGNIMPPKSTWFEPKLRSGLIVHLLD